MKIFIPILLILSLLSCSNEVVPTGREIYLVTIADDFYDYNGNGRKLENALSYLREKGCEKVILACTELSVFQKKEGTSQVCLDAMDVLVREAILASGAEYR